MNNSNYNKSTWKSVETSPLIAISTKLYVCCFKWMQLISFFKHEVEFTKMKKKEENEKIAKKGKPSILANIQTKKQKGQV